MMSSKRLKNAFIGSGLVTTCVGTYVLYDNANKKNVSLVQIAQASFRILRLVRTTVSIIADYKYTIWKYSLNSGNRELTKYEHAKLLMASYQEREEKLTFDLWKAVATKDSNEIYSLKMQIADNKSKIESLAHEISILTATSYLSQTHTRSAIKLRDMCVANKGVYIKLGEY